MSCHDRHLGFDQTGNSALRSADSENPTLEPNVKWIESPVEAIAIRNSTYHEGCIWDDNFGENRL